MYMVLTVLAYENDAYCADYTCMAFYKAEQYIREYPSEAYSLNTFLIIVHSGIDRLKVLYFQTPVRAATITTPAAITLAIMKLLSKKKVQ